MSEERTSTEYRARVYNDDHGYYAEVRPNSDGLSGLCDLVYSDGDSDAKEISFSVSWEMAKRFAAAILVCAENNATASDAPTQ